MFERILAQNCQKFDNFNFEFSMSHHNAHYQSYKNAPVTARVLCNLKMTSFLYQQLSNHGGNLKRKKPMIMSHCIYKDALHNVPFVKYDSPVTARKVAHNSQCLVDLIPPPSDQLEYMELLYKNTQHRKCRTIRKIFCCGAWNLC